MEYTAFWCIRMLYSAEGIEFIIPEGVEDLTIVRENGCELHQVKTRQEGQPAWSLNDVLPILCSMYYHRHAFDRPCEFYFVSNHDAGPNLFPLKTLLDGLTYGGGLLDRELVELEDYHQRIVPEVQRQMRSRGEEVPEESVVHLLGSTRIATASDIIRSRNNIIELADALVDRFPGAQPTLTHLSAMYDQILLLVLRRITTTGSLEARSITAADVVACWSTVIEQTMQLPDLSDLSIQERLTEKALRAGFDMTEIIVFFPLIQMARWVMQRLRALGHESSLLRLRVSLLDAQQHVRHTVCRVNGIHDRPGPYILETLRPAARELAQEVFPDDRYVDERFCLGLLWEDTEACAVWWHDLAPSGTQGAA